MDEINLNEMLYKKDKSIGEIEGILGDAIECLKATCEVCGHTWYIRSPKIPKVCGSCKSSYWDVPRVDNGK